MKKFLIGLLCLLSFSVFSVSAAIEKPEITDHEKVTIYVFRGSGCSHCYEALEYFNDNIGEYSDYIQVVAYETWYDSTNSELASAVAEALGDELSGVPYLVIGDSYHTAGFASSMGTEIIEAALAEYENEDYRDVVAEVAEEFDAEATSLKTACEEEGIEESTTSKEDEKESTSAGDTIAIIAIFGIVVGGIVALVALSRKK